MTNVSPLLIPPKTNIGEIKNTAPAEQLLAAALNAIEQWRKNKKTNAEAIPDNLCQQIFALEPYYSSMQLRRFFRISGNQYRAKRNKYLSIDKKTTTAKHLNVEANHAKLAPPKLCEIKIKPDNPYALEPLPSGKTLVVEFCRSDGQIMKIHTTQDSIPTLMHTFFGEK